MHECLRPFHWEIEFPEVFSRDNPGFDAIVGNPPFAGKNTLAASNRKGFPIWLQTLHAGAHGNADLVAHFFRRAYRLLREGGVFGLIATNTIGQGDTRATGLAAILGAGGSIRRAVRRLKWPGEAAVVVSVVHAVKGMALIPVLDGRPVRRISAYLVEGDLDTSPAPLAANSGKAFSASFLLGMGFTFDDTAANSGAAEGLATMHALIEKDSRNAERIFPYIGGEEVNNDPRQAYHRYAIDFFDRPLRREPSLKLWKAMNESERASCRTTGIVPSDYSDEVAEDWPDLVEIVRRLVKPHRDRQTRPARKVRWWQYAEKSPGLYTTIAPLKAVLAMSRISPHLAFVQVATGIIFSIECNVFAYSTFSPFAVLQSRIHEVWARFFSSSMKDDLRYTPSDCFRTFPFPRDFENDPALRAAGEAYHAHRAALMIARNEGLTKTYNRFHNAAERAPDIVTLRELHAAMDGAVLHPYGWDDLAARAAPEFLEQEADEGKTPKTRLDWPLAFKDEVLARLLALNAERAAAERDAGLSAVPEEDDEKLAEDAAE